MMPKVPSTLQSSLGRNVVQNHTQSRNSKVLLTKQYCYVHNSLNTPTKPMLFPNIMLKLSGLFFACHFFLYIATPHNLSLMTASLLKHNMRGLQYDRV